MSRARAWGLLLGRVLLAFLFVVDGYGKIGNFAGTAKYMAAMGMPLVEPLLVGAILVELAGGLMVAAGWKARWAAAAIFLYLVPVTLVFHAFWAVPAEQVLAQTIQFQKNLAIMGGMLYLALAGPGPLGFDKS